ADEATGLSEVKGGPSRQLRITARFGHGVCLVVVREGLGQLGCLEEVDAEEGRDEGELASVIDDRRQTLSLLELLETPLKVSQRIEGRSHGEVQVDRPCVTLSCLREVSQRGQRLAEARRRGAIRRSLHGLGPGLVEVVDGFLPPFTVKGVVG